MGEDPIWAHQRPSIFSTLHGGMPGRPPRLNLCPVFGFFGFLVFSPSFEQHVQNVRQVLQRQRECGIKLRPKKCDFFKGEVCYVGRVISAEGYKMNPKEVEAVQQLKHEVPTTVRGVRKLMGFLSYYRAYIPDFSRVAKPLYELLAKPKPELKQSQKKKGTGRKSVQLPPSHPIQWTMTKPGFSLSDQKYRKKTIIL